MFFMFAYIHKLFADIFMSAIQSKGNYIRILSSSFGSRGKVCYACASLQKQPENLHKGKNYLSFLAHSWDSSRLHDMIRFLRSIGLRLRCKDKNIKINNPEMPGCSEP